MHVHIHVSTCIHVHVYAILDVSVGGDYNNVIRTLFLNFELSHINYKFQNEAFFLFILNYVTLNRMNRSITIVKSPTVTFHSNH